MRKTVEAIIDESGQIWLLEPLELSHPVRALVTVLETESADDTTLLSEAARAENWGDKKRIRRGSTFRSS